MKRSIAVLCFLSALFASYTYAGTPAYRDFGVKATENGLSCVIEIFITGAAADAGAGGTLIAHAVEHLDRIIDAKMQLVEVELIRGVSTAEPAAATVTITDSNSTLWGPKTIDITTPDALPGIPYGGDDLLGFYPAIKGQIYLTVGDIGDANTLTIKMVFK